MKNASGASAIVARDVRKSFGSHVVLDNVNLTVDEGSILALLGPNGAGKTTIVRILSTLIPADSGSMQICRRDVRSDPDGVRALIGVTGQFSAVDNLLTGIENLRLMTDLRHLGREAGRRRVTELLEQFDLADAGDKLLSTYSGGMRRRLDLAMTLVGQPRVIFLDEPTAGLDPRSRLTMWQIVRELAAVGVTILLTTQYLDEADQLADRIVVIDHGRIVAEGTPTELKSQIPGGHVRLHFAGLDLLHAAAGLIPGAAADPDQLVLQVPADGTVDSLRALLDELQEAHVTIDRLSIHSPDLDDVFLAVTGSHLAGPSNEYPSPRGATPTMTTLALAFSDSRVMLRRNLKRQLRYPSLAVMLVGMPIVFLLLFVYVFGGQLGAGLGAHLGRRAYLDYVVPGLMLITVASVVQGTSIMVAMDMTGGIIDRFRTMAIARASVLTGHVLGSLVQAGAGIGVLIGVAFALGFHANGGLLHWIAAISVLALFAFALIWLAVALGLAAKSVETASNTPMILMLLPFFGSGFVSPATMPTGLRQFAEYQPFTAVTDSVRGLLTNSAIGDHVIATIAWSVGIAIVAYAWAVHLYNGRRAAEPR